jgi:two-component system sensor histidine kinase YesM
MLNQVNKNIDSHIRTVENFIDYLSEEREVKEFFQSGDQELAVYIQDIITNKMNRYAYFYKEIAGVILVNNKDHYISNVMYRTSRDPFIEEKWYTEAVRNAGSLQFHSSLVGRNINNIFNYSADQVVSVSKAITNGKDKRVLGVILVDIDLSVLTKEMEHISLGNKGFIYIMNSNNDIVYAPINKVVYRINTENIKGDKGQFSTSVLKEGYEVIYKSSGYTKWKTIAVFPVRERLKVVSNIKLYSVLIALITLIIAVIIAVFFTRTIVRPITKLRNLMKITEEGDFDVHFRSKYNDEIGQLGNSFNNMIKEIRNLIKLVQIEERNKRKAEIKTLQAQIKPHFLYNTLDTIQWMAQEHEAKDVVEIVGALTSLLRIGINKGEEQISVRDEVKHVTSYLTIQKIRYEDKLDYEIEVEEEILGYSIIKLILQPLVENAIYHGIKEKRGKGYIKIIGEKVEGKLHFIVSDNGKGIAEDRLREIKSVLKGAKENHNLVGYGIYNVNERIRLNYGDEYGLVYESVEGEGTIVHVWHPITMK